MKPVTAFCHDFLAPALHRQALCLDGTLGTGMDSRFFLDHGVHAVFAFEIREEIALQTEKTIDDKRLHVYPCSHERAGTLLGHYAGQLDAAVFNFGYYPKQRNSQPTQTASSLKAVQEAFTLLKPKGRMCLVFYSHEEGKKEAEAIMAFLETLHRAGTLQILTLRHPFNADAPWAALCEKRSHNRQPA